LTKRNQKNERRPRDFYPTPEKGVLPLLPWLPENCIFAEPCAGEGDLVKHLTKEGHTCWWISDIQEYEGIGKKDALKLTEQDIYPCEFIITNPPWSRDILHPMITHFRNLRPTWLLLDADWCHTRQSSEYMKYCQKIVSVGRLKWIPDSTSSGLDNCSWYLFQPNQCETIFHGR
jgi:hypothetical protein